MMSSLAQVSDGQALPPLSAAEQFALNRDGLSRQNPDELLNGFFPAWAVLLFLLSGNSSSHFKSKIKFVICYM
jgi:hypothetical protein